MLLEASGFEFPSKTASVKQFLLNHYRFLQCPCCALGLQGVTTLYRKLIYMNVESFIKGMFVKTKNDIDVDWESSITKLPSGCWVWTGKPIGQSSRHMFELFFGKHNTKKYVFVKCKTKKCCNPDHLLTSDQRKIVAIRHKMFCPAHHRLTLNNTVYDRFGKEMCKRCKEIADVMQR